MLKIQGSENPDGGALLDFWYDTNESPPPAPSGPALAMYIRGDGTSFFTWPTFGYPIYTEIDAPGGVVAGSYAFNVATSMQPDAATLSLSGTFCTLRLRDGQPRPCPHERPAWPG